MRDLKKYFFETLIQLTILANVFRQYNRFNQPGDGFTHSLRASGDLDFLNFYNNNSHYNINNNNISQSDGQDFLNSHYRIKETQSHLADLKMLGRLNRILPQHLIIVPASFIDNNNNNNNNNIDNNRNMSSPSKELGDMSESGVLFNAIELNASYSHTLRKEFEMDIELQNLIEQDIDFGIKNDYYFQVDTLQQQQQQQENEFGMLYKNGEFQHLKTKNGFQMRLEESQKYQDILSATKFIERETTSEGYKLFVEEDTGEILYIFKREELTEPQGLLNGSKKTNCAFDLFEFNNATILIDQEIDLQTETNLTKKDLFEIEMPLKHETNDQIVLTKPIFLSQTSVCKELNKLSSESKNDTDEASSIHASNITFDHSFMTLNERTLNEYLEDSLYVDNPKSSFDIQKDLYLQQETGPNKTASNITTVNTVLATNQSHMGLDAFQFDEEFINTFEANLNKFNVIGNNSNDNLLSPQQLNTMSGGYYTGNQTLSFPPLEPTRHETESLHFLADQLDIGDMFKSFGNSSNEDNINITKQANYNNNNNNTNVENHTNDAKTLSHNDTSESFAYKSSLPGPFVLSHDEKLLNENELKQELVDEENFTLSSSLREANTAHSLMAAGNRAGIDLTSDEYLATVRGLNHNHTYMDGIKAEEESEVYHPYSYKNKLKKMLKNLNSSSVNQTGQQESRDQLLLQENRIGLTLYQVVDSSPDEFNELVKTHEISSEQLSIIKDIRRRGKNKLAAQSCRKRKIDSIDSLKENVEQLSKIKSMLESEQSSIENEIAELALKFDVLYEDLMEEQYDLDDPIVIHMNTLKSQLSISIQTKQKSVPPKRVNTDESDSNSQEYESTSSQLSHVIESDYEEEEEVEDEVDEDEDDDVQEIAHGDNSYKSLSSKRLKMVSFLPYETKNKKIKK